MLDVMANPDDVLHAFRTPFGIPPSKEDRPVCGATLTDAYDFQGIPRDHCRACEDALRRETSFYGNRADAERPVR